LKAASTSGSTATSVLYRDLPSIRAICTELDFISFFQVFPSDKRSSTCAGFILSFLSCFTTMWVCAGAGAAVGELLYSHKPTTP
jgi:hypothetical protein